MVTYKSPENSFANFFGYSMTTEVYFLTTWDVCSWLAGSSAPSNKQCFRDPISFHFLAPLSLTCGFLGHQVYFSMSLPERERMQSFLHRKFLGPSPQSIINHFFLHSFGENPLIWLLCKTGWEMQSIFVQKEKEKKMIYKLGEIVKYWKIKKNFWSFSNCFHFCFQITNSFLRSFLSNKVLLKAHGDCPSLWHFPNLLLPLELFIF